jgi:pyrimidine deaminase RibD-like protein
MKKLIRDSRKTRLGFKIAFMLISEKLPQGSIYPQITQAPISTYDDFLNFFRGGHTVDDNLSAHSVQSTMQYIMFSTAIASGHLTKLKNTAIPDEFLADISLTEAGSERIQPFLDRKFCEMAVAEARKSIAEDDGESHPHVGAVAVKDGKILSTGYRGETGAGRHAEFCAIKKINDDVDHVDLSGCTVYTTLEPCSERNSPNKTACATRLINAKASRVVYGMADKDESVYGHVSLSEANIAVSLFPGDLIQELVALNKSGPIRAGSLKSHHRQTILVLWRLFPTTSREPLWRTTSICTCDRQKMMAGSSQ